MHVIIINDGSFVTTNHPQRYEKRKDVVEITPLEDFNNTEVVPWSIARLHNHDISGCDNPSEMFYYKSNNVFYPLF